MTRHSAAGGCEDGVMLDKNRIRLMTKMAIYEKKYAEEDLKITGYYKKDYSSINTWITIIWITAGYILAGGLFLMCNADGILEGITLLKLVILAAIAAGGYLALVIVYAIGASGYYKKKHTRAKQRVKKYYRDLSRLEKMYKKEQERT